jgi:hypothetical protein
MTQYQRQLAADRAAARALGNTLTPTQEGIRATMFWFATGRDCPYRKGTKAAYDWRMGMLCPYAPEDYCKQRGRDYATASPDQYKVEVLLGLREYAGTTAVVKSIKRGDTENDRTRSEAA